MKNLANQLREFVSDVPNVARPTLTPLDERLFRSLKTTGERATKGRLISKCVFESRHNKGLALYMLMEGRHAMSVARQVVRRFEDMNELEFAEAMKTKTGACVILRPKGE